MTRRTPAVLALLVCATFGLPTCAAAASLSPLGDTLGLDAGLPGLGPIPGLSDPTHATDLDTSSGAVKAPAPFKFVDDTGLDANPLRGILPESQWANPKAVENGLIRRR